MKSSGFWKEFDEAFDRIVELGASSLMESCMKPFMESDDRYKKLLMRRALSFIYAMALLDMEKWFEENGK